jgi:hypothetical protein
MATYKVLSDNFSLGKEGETVDSKVLEGCNVEALIEAGHLAEVATKVSKQATSEQEK